MKLHPSLALLGAALTLMLAACTSTSLDPAKIDYKSSGHGPSLEVPPDLTQLPAQSRYTMPDGTVSASSYQAGQKVVGQNTGSAAAANTIGGVHFVRQGTMRWLHVDQSPDKVWPLVRDFWQDSGFLLITDDQKIGVMQTDWAENRAKIPDDFIRNTLGKLLDSLYSTGERDRFRTRVERTDDNGSDIFITHQGVEEVYTNSMHESTSWQPRAADPGLEAEFLRRLMVKLGASAEQARAQIPSAAALGPTPAGAARIVQVGSAQVLEFTDEFDRAWRRVGLALDRSGFTVEDRDRTRGAYAVRYADPTAEKKEPGFFSKLFGGSSAPMPTTRYHIQVTTKAGVSRVSVSADNGSAAQPDDIKRIIKVLEAELK